MCFYSNYDELILKIKNIYIILIYFQLKIILYHNTKHIQNKLRL
jgi:hypothetical protein